MVDQRQPARLNDVGRYADGRPDRVAIGRLQQHAHFRRCGVLAVDDAHLVVGQVNVRQFRIERLQRLAQRAIERMHRTIAFRRGDFALAIHLHLDDRRRTELALGRLLTNDLEVFEFKERTVAPELLADDQLERTSAPSNW